MSIQIGPEGELGASISERLRSCCAIIVASPIVKMRPAHIQSILRWLAKGSRPATMEQAVRARNSACLVSARCAGLGCLLRSVATYIDCRMQGTTPDWCTGFRVEPFAAHAWVEVDGYAAGEPGALSSFTTVLAVRPHEGTV